MRHSTILLVCLFLLVQTFVYAEPPKSISGIYPHLAMFNDEAECGTGAVVYWADRLWATTYGPHLPHGSTDKLYEITPDLQQIIREESVGGTHANRMIHKESEQLIIGLHFIDKDRNVRTVSPSIMPGRMTGTTRHLTHPAEKVYFASMEEGLYEVDVKTLAVHNFIRDGNAIKQGYTVEEGISTLRSRLPGYHGKGFYYGQGRVVYANNGDNDPRRLFDPTIESGALAEWTGSGDWQMVRRNQFCEVTGPGGIYGNENPETDPIWSTGWDYKSLLLMLLDNGEWSVYRLPKASHTYDGAHGWHTEWPRIGNIGEEDLLMTMHGTFWKFPKTFTSKNSAGIMPRSTYLKVVADFCRWKERVVFACDDTARSEFSNTRKVKGNLAGPGRSQSNLWFIEPKQLDNFGTLLGRGAVWQNEKVEANVFSDPFLLAGYKHRTLIMKSNQKPNLTVQVDEKGDGNWRDVPLPEPAETMQSDDSYMAVWHELPTGVWIRLKAQNTLDNATAMFHYRGEDNRSTEPAKKFTGLAGIESENVNGGTMLARGANLKTLRFIAQNAQGELGVYDLDGELNLLKADDPAGLQWTKERSTVPVGVLNTDEASVLLIDDKGRWRLPKGDARRDKDGVLGAERVCREVATERDLFHAHGTFYELPAENSGGVQKIRPIASHPFRIKDYASYRGMLVMSGLENDTPNGTQSDNPHIIKSDDGTCALWCGVIDDLWELGKPRGVGGPWKNTAVKAGEPSDPYLMAGYDKKRLELYHRSVEVVSFRIELDISGDGNWALWRIVEVPASETKELELTVDAYWIRLGSNKDTSATATFVYE